MPLHDVDALAEGLFDAEVAVCASRLVGRWEDLFPEERACVAPAVAERVHAFATGRICARRLLAGFGVSEAVLPAARDGRPLWPEGFVGSISHAGDLCVVAVARRAEVASLGIDVEVDHALEESTWDLVCTPAELAWVRSQAAARRGRLVTALFSAKETVYKCASPWSSRPFEPRAIAVEWDGASTASFAAIGDTTVSRQPIVGTIAIRRGWIFTAATLPAAQSPSR